MVDWSGSGWLLRTFHGDSDLPAIGSSHRVQLERLDAGHSDKLPSLKRGREAENFVL